MTGFQFVEDRNLESKLKAISEYTNQETADFVNNVVKKYNKELGNSILDNLERIAVISNNPESTNKVAEIYLNEKVKETINKYDTETGIYIARKLGDIALFTYDEETTEIVAETIGHFDKKFVKDISDNLLKVITHTMNLGDIKYLTDKIKEYDGKLANDFLESLYKILTSVPK